MQMVCQSLLSRKKKKIEKKKKEYFKMSSAEFVAWHAKRLTLLLLNTPCPVLANSVDPDQLASEEANWSGSALFVI